MSIARSIFGRWVSAALLVVVAAGWSAVAAQGPTGVIEGVVRDEQGGVLPGVTMTLRNQDTGVTRTRCHEADGRYTLPGARARHATRARRAVGIRDQRSRRHRHHDRPRRSARTSA